MSRSGLQEETNQRRDKELKMRVRVIAQTFTDLWRHRAMLNPFRSGLYGVQLISHKVMRYLVPFFLIAIVRFVSRPCHRTPFLSIVVRRAGTAGYLCAAFAWLLEKVGVRSRVLALPQYFVLANLASLIAFFKFLRGERYARWEPIQMNLELRSHIH